MEIQVKRVPTEIKNLLRRNVNACDVCGSRKFDFKYDGCIEDLVWMRCKHCRRVLYLGEAGDIEYDKETMYKVR